MRVADLKVTGLSVHVRRRQDFPENSHIPVEPIPPVPQRKASFLLATALSESAEQVFREFLVGRVSDHDPMVQRTLQILRTHRSR